MPAINTHRAVFLDRDGTLNLDTGYVHSIEAWVWLPGVQNALWRLSSEGFKLIVVSNQSGLARKYFSEEELHTLEAWVDKELAKFGVAISGWYYCPHLPEITGPCHCRKPASGLLEKAAKEHAIDLTHSWMLGDKLSDVQAGLACGCQTIKLGLENSQDNRQAQALGAVIAKDLPAAVSIILQRTR
ncbi:MAG: D-glycero-beta-D-manno-heptose 1,7-bisphosphate 7-phosphatase [Desulfovibrio sp.]|nr:D-glycero-beta-D-manno-heptose 1,7-bisphosphate 7-phosphatase [Desulfovibrio sp.]